MPRPLSQLIYSNAQQGSESPFVITLHDEGEFGKDVAAWGKAVAPQGRVVTLESYKGVFVGHSVVGYTWFIGPSEAPSPIFFGDALSEIERFLWDDVDRSNAKSPEKPILVGIGQGGIMAIATALAVPELVAGVVAIDAFLPIVKGWVPPLAPLNGMPMLLVNPREVDRPTVLSGTELIDQLRRWNASVETVSFTDLSPDKLVTSDWVARAVASTPSL